MNVGPVVNQESSDAWKLVENCFVDGSHTFEVDIIDVNQIMKELSAMVMEQGENLSNSLLFLLESNMHLNMFFILFKIPSKIMSIKPV